MIGLHAIKSARAFTREQIETIGRLIAAGGYTIRVNNDQVQYRTATDNPGVWHNYNVPRVYRPSHYEEWHRLGLIAADTIEVS